MSMKYSILLVVVLAWCSAATLLQINGQQGDYCTRNFAPSITADVIEDWDLLPAGPARFDCARSPATLATPPQYFPTAATTLFVSTAAPRAFPWSVVECRVLTQLLNPNACQQLTGTFYIADSGLGCNVPSVAPIAVANDPTTITIPFAPNDLEETPRKLCYTSPTGNTFWTGFYVAWYFRCSVNAECVTQYDTAALAGSPQRLRTTCCGGNGLTPNDGVCINADVQECCGNRPIERSLDKCCNFGQELVRYQWQQCPCRTGTACPTGETCCQRTKFADFTGLGNPLGTCYNPSASTLRCCNDGGVYNSGTQQCCSINGVQALDVPCPCGKNEDCLGGQSASQQNKNMVCCKQRFPTTARTPEFCSAFSNYQSVTYLGGTDQNLNLLQTLDPRSVRNSDIEQLPADLGFAPGRALPQFQRCLGQCINTTFEICCNGARCYGQYERCCNQTCCNKYLSSCLEHNVDSTRGFATNSNNFGVTFAECTTVESMNAFRAFWVYVVPTFLLVATISTFAIVILFVINFTTRAYSLTEKGLLLFSVIALLLALPTFFSPIYKYGLVGVVTALICILSASARVRWLNVIAVGVTLLFILYLFDPFHGNNFLNVASLRQSNGNPWTWASGVIYSIRGMWPGNAQNNNYCVTFYHGYFQIGQRDFARWSNPAVRHFGYCDRGWATALLVFQGLQLLVSVWLFVLALLLLLLRFRKSLYEQIELEIVHHDY